MKKHGKSLSLEFTQEWGEKKRLKFEGFSMSDGTLRAIGLLAAVFQRPAPSLIAIEEPEATIHPGALESVLDLLRHASKQMQVVITTHSPDLLEAKWIEDRNLRIVEWQEGATRVAPVSEVTRQALQTHLMSAGELLRSNALDPAPLFNDHDDLNRGHLFEDLASDSMTRHGKPAVTLVSASEVAQLEHQREAGPEQGLISVAGGWEGSEELVERIAEIRRTPPRPDVDLEWRPSLRRECHHPPKDYRS